MLVNRQNRVFVAQRLDSEFDAWQMPQGGIDPGEEPRVAALRELQEETGVSPELVTVDAETAGWITYDLPHDLVPKIWKGRWRGQKQRWFLMRFHGDDGQINIQTEHPEFSQWAWADHRDLVDKIVPFKRDVYARVVADFSQYL